MGCCASKEIPNKDFQVSPDPPPPSSGNLKSGSVAAKGEKSQPTAASLMNLGMSQEAPTK